MLIESGLCAYSFETDLLETAFNVSDSSDLKTYEVEVKMMAAAWLCGQRRYSETRPRRTAFLLHDTVIITAVIPQHYY